MSSTHQRQSRFRRPVVYSLGGKKPLPPIHGPKLQGFHHRKSDIEYLELLSVPPDEADGSGGHAHVFKVRIEGELYALKVFKFFNVKRAREDIYPFWNPEIDTATFTFQDDPFFAECRAYGKIQEIQKRRQPCAKTGKVPDIAIPCYGFLGIRATVEEHLSNKFNLERGWNRPEAQYDLPADQREPFRALVKQFVDGTRAVVSPRNMLRDLRLLRANGVFQQHVCAKNYLNGLLLNFSVAWTAPHWIFDAMDEWNVGSGMNDELYGFDKMMESENIKTKVRAVSEPTRMKLRRRKGRHVRV